MNDEVQDAGEAPSNSQLDCGAAGAPAPVAEKEPGVLRRIAKRVLNFLLLLYVSLALFAWLVSDRLIFLPHEPGYEMKEPYEKITSPDGQELATLYLRNHSSMFHILYSHGNAEDLADLEGIFPSLVKQGFSVFAYDYSGYGRSNGVAGVRQVEANAELVWQHLTETLKVPPENIILWGRSVGTGPTCYLASKYKPAAVVLQSPFLSCFRVAIPFKVLPFDSFPNLHRIARFQSGPVLVIHGRDDEIIPFWHGEQLATSIPEARRQTLFLDRTGHNDVERRGGRAIRAALETFLERITSGQ